MRRQQEYSAATLLGYALAEIEKLKGAMARITDGRSVVWDSTGSGGSPPAGPPGPAPAHVLYGSKHTRALRVVDGGGLDIDFDQGAAVIDETFFAIGAGSLTLPDNDTSYVFVNNAGAVAFNITGFPNNSIPLAEVVTAAGAVSSVSDRRSYLWGHHGPKFEGNVVIGDYARVGSVAAPTNVTAGDLGVERLLVGADTAIEATALLDVEGGALIFGRMNVTEDPASKAVATDTGFNVFHISTITSGAWYELQSLVDANPAGASSAIYTGFRVFAETRSGNAQNLTGFPGLLGGQAIAKHQGTGLVSNMFSFNAASHVASSGDVTSQMNFYSQIQFLLASTATIGTARHLYLEAPTLGAGPGVITNYDALTIEGFTGAGTRNIGINLGGMGTAAIWFNTDTAAQGILVWGTARDTNLYRASANILATDDFLTVGGDLTVTGGNIFLGADVTIDRLAANVLGLGVGDQFILDRAQFTTALLIRNTGGAAGDQTPSLQFSTKNGTNCYLLNRDALFAMFDADGSTIRLALHHGVGIHVNPFGTPDVDLEVSNSAATGGGTIHRASSATHSLRALKERVHYLGAEANEEALRDVLSLRHVDFHYKRDPQEHRGLIFEEAPESVRGPHGTVVIDRRIANLELAVQRLSRRLDTLAA